MNKKLKGLLLTVLIVTLSFNMLPLGAQNVEDEPTPMSEVVLDAYATLTATGTQLKARALYFAGTNLSVARVYVYIQRYVDGYWRAASSSRTCAWVNESTAWDDEFIHYFTMTETGSYRVKAVFYLYESDTVYDRVEAYAYYTYNG